MQIQSISWLLCFTAKNKKLCRLLLPWDFHFMRDGIIFKSFFSNFVINITKSENGFIFAYCIVMPVLKPKAGNDKRLKNDLQSLWNQIYMFWKVTFIKYFMYIHVYTCICLVSTVFKYMCRVTSIYHFMNSRLCKLKTSTGVINHELWLFLTSMYSRNHFNVISKYFDYQLFSFVNFSLCLLLSVWDFYGVRMTPCSSKHCLFYLVWHVIWCPIITQPFVKSGL